MQSWLLVPLLKFRRQGAVRAVEVHRVMRHKSIRPNDQKLCHFQVSELLGANLDLQAFESTAQARSMKAAYTPHVQDYSNVSSSSFWPLLHRPIH